MTPKPREAGFVPFRRSAEHGFTLVEVMIALLIFGMIASAGVALLSFSVRAQAMTTARLDDVGALGRLSSLLTADLAQALDRPARDERGTLLPAFVGDAKSVTLVRGGWSNLDAAPRPSAQKVSYRLTNGTIERIAWPMIDGALSLPPSALLDRVRAIGMRYRIAGAWADRWDGAPATPLPQAVELTIERADGVRFRQLFLVGPGTTPRPTASPTPGPPDAS